MVRIRCLLWAVFLAAVGLRSAMAAGGTDLEARRDAIEQKLADLPGLIPSAQMHERVGFHGYAGESGWIVIDLRDQRVPTKVVVFPARLGIHGPSGFPSSFHLEIADDPSFRGAVRLGRWQEPAPGAGEQLPFVVIPGNGAAGRFLRLVVDGFRHDSEVGDEDYFRLGEIVVLADGQNVALGRPVTSTRSFEASRRWEPRNLTDGYFWCLPLLGHVSSPTNGFSSDVVGQAIASPPMWVELDLGKECEIDEIHLVPSHPRGLADFPGYGFPSHFRVVADPGTGREVQVLREDLPVYPAVALPNPGSAQVMVSTPGLVARTIRLECIALARIGPGSGQGPSQYALALAELQCWRRGVNIAAGARVACSSAETAGGWAPEALVDGYSSRHALLDWSSWLEGIEARVGLEAELDAIRGRIATARERSLGRMLALAVGAVIVLTVVASGAVILQRWRNRRWQDQLLGQLARDLHDEIGASLCHLAIQSDLAIQQLAEDTPPVERLERLSRMARETIDNMRDVIWMLTPQAGTWAELSHRLEMIARRLLDGIGHQVTVCGSPPDGRPPIDWSRNLVAFLKEALTNVRRHSNAAAASVVIRWDGRLEISVEDDGRGFVAPGGTAAPSDAERHHGLANLRARAEAIGAVCDVSSSPETGTVVRVTTPALRQAAARGGQLRDRR